MRTLHYTVVDESVVLTWYQALRPTLVANYSNHGVNKIV